MRVDLLHSPDLSGFSLWTLVDGKDGEVESITVALPPEAVEPCREFLRRVQWAEKLAPQKRVKA